jgi:3-oxoacyl-[acyl-carrier-protein] synthase II
MIRTAIVGMGVVTPAAIGVPAFAEALLHGRRNISFLTGVPIPRGKNAVGRVNNVAFERPDRAYAMAEFAAREALSGFQHPDLAIIVSTISGDGEAAEKRYPSLKKGFPDESLRPPLEQFPNGVIANRLARLFGSQGPRLVVTNACASGNIALGIALDWIRLGRCTRALVVGVDLAKLSSIWGAERSGFVGHALRPFDAERDGSILGEGAAALLLTADHLLAGAQPAAWLDGFGCVCDDGAGAITLHESGSGLYRAMKSAIEDGACALQEVEYVNAHAPGTKGIDLIETRAIADLFGIHDLAINSTKSITTHLSGASAIAEVIATILQMKGGFIHGNVGLKNPDPKLKRRVAGPEAVPAKINVAISNACGGGGANTSVLLRAPQGTRRSEPADAPCDEIVVTGFSSFASERSCRLENFDVYEEYPEESKYGFYNRAAQLAAVAAAVALRRGGIGPGGPYPRDRVAVVGGTFLGGSPEAAAAICAGLFEDPDALRPSHALDHGMHLGPTLVCRHYGFTGITISLTGSPVAGAQAVLVGADLVRTGRADVAVVMAYDSWDDLLARAISFLPGCALSEAKEGAAAIIIERRSGALGRGAKPVAVLTQCQFETNADTSARTGRDITGSRFRIVGQNSSGYDRAHGAFFAVTPIHGLLSHYEANGAATLVTQEDAGAPISLSLSSERGT